MAWSSDEIARISQMQGAYRLPGGCWAVFKLKTNAKYSKDSNAWPEGVGYSWSILMPGEPPVFRGSRMAGIDNADDKAIRELIKIGQAFGEHRAHRHLPDWTNTKHVNGEDWPLAGNVCQLTAAPANPADLWKTCMECLVELFESIGIEPPSADELVQSKLNEEDFKVIQAASRSLHKHKSSGPTL